jgi:hypothetical protein
MEEREEDEGDAASLGATLLGDEMEADDGPGEGRREAVDADDMVSMIHSSSAGF